MSIMKVNVLQLTVKLALPRPLASLIVVNVSQLVAWESRREK